MGKRFICLFSLLSLCALSLFAVNPHADSISSYLKRGDTASVYKEFAQWQKEEPNSPNVADTWAWFYLASGFNQNMRIDSVAPTHTEDFMELIENDGKAIFLYMDVKIRCDSLKKGFDIIDKEIAKHPDCIDLYRTKGEILMFLANKCSHESIEKDHVDFHHEKGSMTDDQKIKYLMSKALSHPVYEGDPSVISNLPDDVANVYSMMLDRSRVNSNQWYDLFDKKVENGESVMLEWLQGIVLSLMQNANYQSASKLNDNVLKVYPDRYDFRTNKALISMVSRNFESALAQLEVLHKDFPKDDIISMDLAEVYLHTGNVKSAKKLYKTLLKSSNKEVSQTAKKRMETLKKM